MASTNMASAQGTLAQDATEGHTVGPQGLVGLGPTDSVGWGEKNGASIQGGANIRNIPNGC